MKLYPAIDLINGNVVRLLKGDYAQETQYSVDPIAIAQSYEQQGAEYLHIVDLDAAKDSDKSQLDLIEKIAQESTLKIQVGGGIKTASQIDRLLTVGIERVVIGSLAVKNPEQVINFLTTFGSDKIVLALDCYIDENKTAFVTTNAWQETSEFTLNQLLEKYLVQGLQTLLCTDISKDGALTGPNFNLYQQLKLSYPELEILASGGVATLDDIKQLKNLGLPGAILGRALYEKKFTLEEALQC